MTGTTLFKWLLYWSNLTFPFAANFLVHSTIIIIIGLSVKRALRKKGAIFQSFILRVCLIAVFASPCASYFFHSAGMSGFKIQAEFIENMRGVYSPLKDEQTVPMQSSGELKRNPAVSQGDAEKNVPFVPRQKVNEIPPTNSILQDHDTIRIPLLRIPETNIPHAVSRNKGKTQADDYMNRQDGGNGPAHSLKWKILGVLYLLVPAVWAVISLFYLTKLIIGILYIKYICRYAVLAAPDDYKRCRIIAREFGVTAPAILISSYVKSTLLTGLFKPVILLPAGENQKSMASSEVFVHELAHLERRDHVWNQLGQVGKIILPLQPLIGLLTRQIEEVSDYVCDEFVVKHMGNRHTYASQLLHMVISIKSHIPEFTPGIGIISTKSQLRKRIERILDRSHRLSMRTRIREAVSVTALFMTTVILTGFVNFREKTMPFENDRSKTISHAAAALPVSTYLSDDNFDGVSAFEYTSKSQKEKSVLTAETAESDKDRSLPNEITTENIPEITEPALPETEDALTADPSETLSAKSDGEIPDTGLIASAETIFSGHDRGEDRSIPGIQTSDIAPDAISGTERTHSTEGGEISTASHTASPGMFADHSPDVSSGSLFNSDNPGIDVSGFRDNRIKMPAAKAVNVVISEDYENFDLKDQDERREYNIYQSLDKHKNEPAWSPDGKWIAFTDYNRIWIVSPNGGEPTRVYENLHDGFSVGGIESLCFTPDSKKLTFKKDHYDVERGSLVHYNNTKTLYYDDNIDENNSLDTIAVFSNPIPNIECVDISTGEHSVIAEDALQYCWSNDGRYLCYLNWSIEYTPGYHKTDAHGVPALYDTETGKKTVLAIPENAKYGKPSFSPDNTHIVVPVRKNEQADDTGMYSPLKRSEQSDELYMFPVDGSEPKQMTDFGRYIDFPEYSPDGEWILYSDLTRNPDGPDKQLLLYSTVTGERFGYFENPQTRNYLGKWSPDGKRICYVVKETDGNYLYISTFDPRVYELAKPALEAAAPVEFSLRGNYPNPFNMRTTIEYSVPEQGFVSLSIYNIMGQRVRELVHENVEPGVHSAVWDGLDENGNAASSGMYISRLQLGNNISTAKMTLIK